MEKKNKVNLQADIYSLLPNFLKQPINQLRIIPNYLRWYFTSNGRSRTKKLLLPYKNRFAGHRCVIIGNGPSLKQMDLSILEDEYTFGLNRIYLLFPELGFETDFLVVSNGLVMQQFAEEILATKSLKLLNWMHRSPYNLSDDIIFVNARPSRKLFGDMEKGYYLGGGTVTNVAIEFAYYLGFSEVILIGVDHSYSQKGKPGKAIVSSKEDVDHFSPAYFGKGITWQLPNYINMEIGYMKNKLLFEKKDRQIVDATKDGNLQIFPKVIFKHYLQNSKYRNKENM